MPETAKRTARVPILGEDGRISDDYIPAAIGEGVESAEAAATRAETAATSAEGSASAASQSATQASGSASAAGTSATQAQQSATTAGSAVTQAQSAQQAAEAAKTAAETAQSAAAGSAQDAQQSATAAASSAASVADKFIASAQATTLDPGSQATASVADQVLTIGVPKGEKGDKGDTGEKGDTGDQGVQGEKGDPGVAATIAVGSVTGLAAGASPTVVNSGTANAAVLDFGIPKGDKGDKGDPGEVSAVQAAEGSDISVSTDEGAVTIDDSALRARIAELENQAANVVTGTSTGLVSHGEDAFPQKPREVRIKGKTWVNRWSVISGTSNGITVSTDGTGLITVTGTSTNDSYIYAIASGIRAGANITCKLSISAPTDNTWTPYIEIVDNEGAYIKSGQLNGSTTIPSNAVDIRCGIHVYPGQTVNASFRVILVDGTEAPDCFTPPASIASVQPENLVTSGKNLVDMSRQENGFYTHQDDGTINAAPSDTRRWGYATSNIFMSLPAGSYALSSQTAGADNTNNVVVIYDADGTVLRSVSASEFNSGNRITKTVTLSHQSEIGVFWKLIGNGTATIQLELGSIATAYEPSSVTTTLLPEVELRSLPNGTCDELVIEDDGTARVERKLGEVVIDAEHPAIVSSVVPASGNNLPYAIVGNLFPPFASSTVEPYSLEVYSTTWPYTPNLRSRGVYRTSQSIMFVDERFTDVETAQSIINETGGTFVAQVPSSTESQSPVTLRALPAPTFNQYHDSAVPSDTSTTYARDINIVIDNLAKQVAGTAATVAINEATR